MKKYFLIIMLLVIVMSKPSRAQRQEIGLQLYSLRSEFKTDVPGTLAKVKSWDIKEIEGGGTYGLSKADYKKLLADNNLKMVSMGVDYNKLKANDLTATIEDAKEFGAKYVVCYWIPHNGEEFTFDNIKEAAEVFNKTGKTFQENGLSLCYHPHGYEFRPYESGTLFDYLVKNTDPKYFNFEIDVFWVKHPGQDPAALIKKYPNRFLLMHLKDRKPGTPGNQNGNADVETNVVLGAGDVGIAEVMEAAKKSSIKHYFIEDESSRSVEQIPQSLAYLKTLDNKGPKDKASKEDKAQKAKKSKKATNP
jgi:sugar phosphate isomerase/epimerase